MKRLLNGLAVFSLVAVATPVLALAQAQAQETSARPLARPSAPVSEAEFVAGRTANLRAMDANGDGQVTVEERRAAREAQRAARLEARFAQFDANADGVISREEFAMRSAPNENRAGASREAGRRYNSRSAHRVARAGAVTETFDIAAIEQTARTQFAQLDTNGDGQVSVEERRAVRRLAREQRPRDASGGQKGHRARQTSPSTPISE